MKEMFVLVKYGKFSRIQRWRGKDMEAMKAAIRRKYPRASLKFGSVRGDASC